MDGGSPDRLMGKGVKQLRYDGDCVGKCYFECVSGEKIVTRVNRE